MDHLPDFRREILAFEAAARTAAEAPTGGAPLVPSCPGWSVADLIGHLGGVHRFVAHVIRERMTTPPDTVANLVARTPSQDLDLTFLGLPADTEGWPSPELAPHRGPVPAGLIDWFRDGAAALEALFRSRPPDETVWTWSREQTVGFWLRVQAIEAAVHRWDAEAATGTPRPIDTGLAADAVTHTFEVMAPARRAWTQAPPGSGERFRFRRTDGPDVWTVRFDGDEVRSDDSTGPCAVELAGTASDLMLFLWNRIPADRCASLRGDRAALDHYFTLVPPV
ncbi:maleylpyruvate isomerase family mycothiol-dependent enzyme [Streptomyces sp. NPDC018031]|uniref:maleylpyruvate isomerase family mycothiol-dependent enzyme n=1 Tax=Streptomyces sp. NPDC018031 TaxID=3365033 RepID=UPI0037B7D6BB